MIRFEITKKTDNRLRERMKNHYSLPKGFVGRSIVYAVFFDKDYYGHIIAGSCVLHLPGRNEYFNINKSQLNNIVNNVFFNVQKVKEKYPIRNFTTEVVKKWVENVRADWFDKYGDIVLGFETLVELPRSGELYKKAGWEVVGTTKGYTCKRIGEKGSDSWGGCRVWNKDESNLRPKLVLCYKV